MEMFSKLFLTIFCLTVSSALSWSWKCSMCHLYSNALIRYKLIANNILYISKKSNCVPSNSS